MFRDSPLPFGLDWADRAERAGARVLAFREESAYAYRLLLVLGFAGLTGLTAQIVVPLPFTPVPVTGQVLGVLVSAAVLGRWLGPASQVAYVGLGAVGVPWFAPADAAHPFTVGGFGALVGATGGYLVGFIVAAALIGWLVDRRTTPSTYASNLSVLLLGVAVIYAMGSAGLALALHTTLTQTLLYGVVPFLPGDLLKAVLGAGVMAGTVPRFTRSAADGAPPPEGPAPAWGRDLRPRDYALVAGLIAALWLLLPTLAASPLATAPIREFYLLAVGVASAAVVLSLGLRLLLRREARELRASTPG
ncbi:MAG: biotin transporter BioY [Thermoplasmata archaeon]